VKNIIIPKNCFKITIDGCWRFATAQRKGTKAKLFVTLDLAWFINIVAVAKKIIIK
jgi:hypothetical protein